MRRLAKAINAAAREHHTTGAPGSAQKSFEKRSFWDFCREQPERQPLTRQREEHRWCSGFLSRQRRRCRVPVPQQDLSPVFLYVCTRESKSHSPEQLQNKQLNSWCRAARSSWQSWLTVASLRPRILRKNRADTAQELGCGLL